MQWDDVYLLWPRNSSSGLEVKCPFLDIHFPIVELGGDDRRNVPRTVPQLHCIPGSSSGGAVRRHFC